MSESDKKPRQYYLVEHTPTGLNWLMTHHNIPYWVSAALAILGAFAIITITYVYQGSHINGLVPETIPILVRYGVVTCLLALGAALVITSGYVDLSTAGLATISSIASVLTYYYLSPVNPALALGGAFIVGFICAVFNGLLVWYCVIVRSAPSLILTWALSGAYFVGAVLLTNLAPTRLLSTVQGIKVPIPSDFWHLFHTGFNSSLIVVLASIVVLYAVGLPRAASAIGANENSAAYAGVRKNLTMCQVFITNSLLAFFAGLFETASIAQASTVDLFGSELRAIAVAVLGGTVMTGGKIQLLAVAAAALFWSMTAHIAQILPNIFPGLGRYQAEIASLLFVLVLGMVVVLFGPWLGTKIPKVYARKEGK